MNRQERRKSEAVERHSHQLEAERALWRGSRKREVDFERARQEAIRWGGWKEPFVVYEELAAFRADMAADYATGRASVVLSTPRRAPEYSSKARQLVVPFWDTARAYVTS